MDSYPPGNDDFLLAADSIVQGWGQYYHYGNCVGVFAQQQDWLRERLRRWLWKKYDRTLGFRTFFTNERLQGQYGLATLPAHGPWTR